MIFYAHECEEKIGYVFKDKCILRNCFTHTSYSNEHGEVSNEKLEYLGDSILNFIVADYLYKTAKGDEGDLTKRRSEIVSTIPISNAIKQMGVEQFLLVGEGERNRPIKTNMCADLFEAIVAGIYLDGGLENAKRFINENLLKNVIKSPKMRSEGDFKSSLQEYVQKYKLGKIEYKQLKKSGPDHAPEFTCCVTVNGQEKAKGVGGSKKQAEQLAAKAALKKIKIGSRKG